MDDQKKLFVVVKQQQTKNISRSRECGSSSRSARQFAFGFALEYWSQIEGVETKNLIFLDFMGVLLGLMRTRGICLKGQRAYDLKPFYRGKRITVMGAMTENSFPWQSKPLTRE